MTSFTLILVSFFFLINGLPSVDAKLGSNGTSRLGPLLYIYAGVLGGVPVLCCLCICLCVCCRARGSRKNRELVSQQNALAAADQQGSGMAMHNQMYGGGFGGVTPGYGYDQQNNRGYMDDDA